MQEKDLQSLAMDKKNVQRQLESEERFKVVSIVLQLSKHILMEGSCVKAQMGHLERFFIERMVDHWNGGHSPNPARVHEMSE